MPRQNRRAQPAPHTYTGLRPSVHTPIFLNISFGKRPFILRYMATKEELDLALQKNVIDLETKRLIDEYDERLMQNHVPIIYNLRHMRKLFQIKKKDQDYFFGKLRQQSYSEFFIPKRDGSFRRIESPNNELKRIQTWIKTNILDKFDVSPYATGFVKNKCIYDNALPHVNKDLVVNLDLKNFFPSIHYSEVFKVFKYFGYTTEVSHLLTRLCTNCNNVLPQGAPTSPALSNLICLKLDKRLSRLAEVSGFAYTRYADDITISGNRNIKSTMPLIYDIIEDENFSINEKKTRFQYSFQRQEVTGLVVNKKVSITKKLIREIENAIYFCKKYGVVNHMEKIKCDKSFYKEHLFGLAYFVKMINEKKGILYLEKLSEIDWIY